MRKVARRRRDPLREKSSPLVWREPVSEAHTDPTNAFHAANTRRQLGTEEASVGRLICHPSNRSEPKVDGGWCVPALLEVNAVPQNDGTVEREARLGTVPGDELPNRVVVGSLTAN